MFYLFKSEMIIKMEVVIEVNNKFIVEVYKVLKNDQKFIGKNFFYLLSSLSIVFVMIYFGVKGNIVGQMVKVFKWDVLLQE